MSYTEAERYRNLMNTLEAIKNIDEDNYVQQDQRSLYDQVLDLISIAEKHGKYDAADWLKTQIRDWPGSQHYQDRR